MDPDTFLDEQAAIDAGRAFARPQGIRMVRVTGKDATEWLHDLITADVASLDPGQSRRSLLLTPTGRIRADFMVGRDAQAFWLLQSVDQPEPLHESLAIYVLSSDVALTEISGGRSLWTLVGGAADRSGTPGLSPSIVGPGRDVLVAGDDEGPPWDGSDTLEDLVEVGGPALERWRILRGDPRMGVDFDEGALPAAVGLDATIDATKGCFLGQESVAKIRNLGHPPSVLLHRRADGSVPPAMPVFDEATQVGVATSAAPDGRGGTVAIIRVEWASREASLSTAEGVRLLPVPPLST